MIIAEDPEQPVPRQEPDSDVVDDSDPDYNPDGSSASENEDDLVAEVPGQHDPRQEPDDINDNNNVSFVQQIFFQMQKLVSLSRSFICEVAFHDMIILKCCHVGVKISFSN